MSSQRPHILDCAATLSDATRCRILGLLDGQELSVSELCAALQLPQSTASRHLRLLTDGGWLLSRREGTSHVYSLREGSLEPAILEMWRLIRQQLEGQPAWLQDRQRLVAVLAERQSRSRAFFATTAGQWDRLRDELFGSRFDLHALLGLLDSEWVVGDLACGTGRVAAALAPFVRRVLAVDASRPMLEAAHARLDHLETVEVLEGELEALPIPADGLDAATLFLALHHLPDPSRALAEARRVLKPGGRLLVVDMAPHDREAYRQEMGHVWLGFSAEQMGRYLSDAGFTGTRYQPLPADRQAMGPTLFAAVGKRPLAAADGAKRSSTLEPIGVTD